MKNEMKNEMRFSTKYFTENEMENEIRFSTKYTLELN